MTVTPNDSHRFPSPRQRDVQVARVLQLAEVGDDHGRIRGHSPGGGERRCGYRCAGQCAAGCNPR